MQFTICSAYLNCLDCVRMCIIFVLLMAAAHGLPASAEELFADRLLAPDRLNEIVIEMPAEDWRELCQQTRDIGAAFSGGSTDPFTYFKGSITIDASTLSSGAYQYSLYVDGTLIDTKQMVLAK